MNVLAAGAANSPAHLFIWLAAAAVYLTPAIIAWTRPAPHRGRVAVVNVLAGWTVIGWVVALVMACRSRAPAPAREG